MLHITCMLLVSSEGVLVQSVEMVFLVQVGRDGSRSDVPQTEQRTSFMGGGCLGDGDDGAGRSRVVWPSLAACIA